MSSAIEQQIETALAGVTERGKPATIYFVGCGGSFSQMNVPKYAIDREAKSITAEAYTSAEFIARRSPRLGSSSVVVLCSKSGDTPETAAAARYAAERGAYTIGLTVEAESPLAKAVHARIDYDARNDVGTGYAPIGILLRLAFGVLAEFEGNPKLDALKAGLAQMPAIVDSVREKQREAALAWGEKHKRASVIYTMSSGANYGVAYLWSLCILQEMQWIHSQPIHSGEYFHGPFEITDFDVPFVILKGLGEHRAIDQRALNFANKYSEKVLELDAAEFPLDNIDESVREYVTGLVYLPVLRAYAVALADARGHPLTVRRYMWRMEY
ncbi:MULTISPECIES: SIS domain-containing protein [unclassified Sphingobium]|uniref:SIS domain-containing protein n=1 Tax=unclassified Sphingobium TaxID=2611147 RepID=UPI0035A57428